MDPLLIPIVAILMPLVLAPTVIFLKHRHSRREWEHLERMKAMDFHMPMQSPRRAGTTARRRRNRSRRAVRLGGQPRL